MKQEVTNFGRFFGVMKHITFEDKEDEEDYKRQLVSQYTGGRTDSLREITRREYEAMCEGLEKVCGTGREKYRMELRKHRSTVLHLMQKAGVDTTDWNRVNAFCKDKRISGKEFRLLNIEELDAVAVKLRVIRRKTSEKSVGTVGMVGMLGMVGSEIN
jgi:hypothetical protein